LLQEANGDHVYWLSAIVDAARGIRLVSLVSARDMSGMIEATRDVLKETYRGRQLVPSKSNPPFFRCLARFRVLQTIAVDFDVFRISAMPFR